MPSFSQFCPEDEIFNISGSTMHYEWNAPANHSAFSSYQPSSPQSFDNYGGNCGSNGLTSAAGPSPPSNRFFGNSGMSAFNSIDDSLPTGNNYAVNSSTSRLHHQNLHQQRLFQSCGGNACNGNNEVYDMPSQQQQRHWMGARNLSGTTALPAHLVGPNSFGRDRVLEYLALGQTHGFIVGRELERVKENSRHANNQSFCRISAHFKTKYGESDSKTKATYLQLGVRVPSKEHVSEIVGKGGAKIKNIREETGALITTPGENEDHVFIIEAPPEIAFHVAQHLRAKAEEITANKASERRRGSGSGYSSRLLLARGRIAVPQELVGKIIGTQGSIITTIQKDTGTEIKSPPKDPSGATGAGTGVMAEFEISAYQSPNLQCNEAAEGRIRQAKQLIGHLVMRQLERRDEEEGGGSGRDSGRNSRMEAGSSNGNSESRWIWTDVVQMDPKEAKEVIDRILQESKNKTKKATRGSLDSPDSPEPPGMQFNGNVLSRDNSLDALFKSNSPMNDPSARLLKSNPNPYYGSNNHGMFQEQQQRNPWDNQPNPQHMRQQGHDCTRYSPCRPTSRPNWLPEAPFFDNMGNHMPQNRYSDVGLPPGSLDRICMQNFENEGPVDMLGNYSMNLQTSVSGNERNFCQQNRMNFYGSEESQLDLLKEMNRLNLGSDPDVFSRICNRESLTRTMSDTTAARRPLQFTSHQNNTRWPELNAEQIVSRDSDSVWPNFHLPPNSVDSNGDLSGCLDLSSSSSGFDHFDHFSSSGTGRNQPNDTNDWLCEPRAYGIIGDRRKRNTPSPPTENGS